MADAFERERDKQLDDMERAELAAVAAVLVLLNQLRSNVIARIAEAGDLVGNIPAMRQVEAAVSRDVSHFQQQAVAVVDDALDKAAIAGTVSIDAPLARIGLPSPAVNIPLELMTTAKTFSADLITNLTADTRMKINGILRQAAMGAVSTQEAISLVGRSLESPGVFKNIAARAATIVRTEVLRLQSQAAHLRMTERARMMRAAGYELRKSWLTARDLRVRASHIVAGVRYTEPIPVDQPFIVGGQSAMFPRDPTLSADESVNCRCTSMPVVVKAA